MRKSAWTTIAVMSVLGLSACGQKNEQRVDNAANETGAAMADMVNTADNAIDDVKRAATPTPSGKEFADRAAKSDAFEIEAAKLAATNAEAADVKSFATMMIAAHTESTAKIKAAASAASPAITPDPALTEDQKKELAELKGLKGAAFDKEYIDGQEDAHEDALDLMKKYATDGDVPALKKAAGEIAPVVEKHLASVKALDRD